MAVGYCAVISLGIQVWAYVGVGVMSQLNYFELCDMLVPGRETCKIIVCCTLAVRLSS